MSTQEGRQISAEYAVSLLFYRQQLSSDKVLIVEGSEFPRHKMVLVTMFMSGLSESRQRHVRLRNVGAATNAYTGN